MSEGPSPANCFPIVSSSPQLAPLRERDVVVGERVRPEDAAADDENRGQGLGAASGVRKPADGGHRGDRRHR